MMLNKIVSMMALFVLLLIGAALGQDNQGDGVLRLGITQQEVRKSMGRPDMIWIPRAQKYDEFANYSIAAGIWGNVADVYRVPGIRTEYEVRVFYAVDETKSRLHPDLRVSGFDIIPDKKVPLNKFLLELREAQVLCRRSCKVYYSNESSPELFIVSSAPSTAEIEIADQAASSWRPSSWGGQWVPGITVLFDDAGDASLDSRDASMLMFHAVDIGFEEKESRGRLGRGTFAYVGSLTVP